MPTYEYVCFKCEHQFDLFQSITELPLTICPKEKCSLKRWGKGRIKRAIGTGAGILFKGSGFYTTDYRSDGYKQAARKESASAAPAAGGETKPAPKVETKPKDDPKGHGPKPAGK